MNKKGEQVLMDYFDVLRRYVACGYLEVLPAAGEAYVTWAGIHTLAGTDGELREIEEIKKSIRPGVRDARIDILSERISDKFLVAARGVWSYSRWLDADADGYRLYRQASETAPGSPYVSHAVEQAGENMRKMPDVSEQAERRLDGKAFALHVVADRHPHDLFYTIFYERRRNLLLPWKEREHMEIISYRK